MVRRRYDDPNQLAIDFAVQVESFVDATRSMLELVVEPPEPEPWADSEEELYVELAASCKAAIRDSGLSREEVLDRVNRHFGRTGSVGADPRVCPEKGAHRGAPLRNDGDDQEPRSKPKSPVSIHMFNNYLSKPGEIKLPVWVVYGICIATGSLRPFRALVAGLGGKVISANEETELLLGKLEQHIREGASIKRQLQRELSGRSR